MIFIVVIEVIELPLNIRGDHFIFESQLVGIGNAIAGQPTSPISPFTLILVILSSAALFLLMAGLTSLRDTRARDIAGVLGLIVALTGFTVILSYLYGAPLTYGAGLIPVAAPTALAFLAVGIGVVTGAGQKAMPLRYFSGDSIRVLLLRTFLPLTIVVILAGTGIEITLRFFSGPFTAVLTGASIVIFCLITGLVVYRVSGYVGNVIETARREQRKAEEDLRIKNTELEAAFEEITATEEELRQNYDELIKSQREQQQAEEEIKRANAYNRSLIEASLDPLVTINLDGTINDVNEATINVTGLSREGLIGTDFSNYFTEPEKAKAGYKTVFRDGSVRDYELRIRNRNGKVIPVLYNATIYQDSEGEVTGVFAAARDITEKKRAEEALQKAHDELEERVEQRTEELRQRNEELGAVNEELTATQEELRKTNETLSGSEERYRTRFNALIEGFCVIEMVFDEAGRPVDYRFLEINEAFEAQTGLHDAQGKLMRDLAPDHEQHWFEIYGKIAVTGEPAHFENEARALNRWYEVRAFRIGGPDSRKVAICFNDITERKKAEESLKEALTEKEVLLSEIHHRVKNNLTAFISLLSLDGSYEDTESGRALRKDLQNRARSMALIHETLYRTGNFSNVDMEVYLKNLVSQVASSYRESERIRTVVDVHGIPLDISRATTAGLIINELVTNSFKYAFPPGFDCIVVRGEPCTIWVSLSHENGTDMLTVADNGCGLPEGFDPFTTKSLGLKLVNFLARH
ncbi:MAG: PAS domain S-box protein, partial [Methanoregula sp.]